MCDSNLYRSVACRHISIIRKELVRQVEILEDRLDYYQKELQAIYSDCFAPERVAGESQTMGSCWPIWPPRFMPAGRCSAMRHGYGR